MMATNPFPDWLSEVLEDEVVVRPDDINTEARCNQWSFTLSPEQAACVTVVDVLDFADVVAAGWLKWLTARGAGPTVMYWWHDSQAGQLRFSLVSAVHGYLPFNREIVAAPSLVTVAAAWLGASHIHGIPLGELRMLDDNSAYPDPEQHELHVWSKLLDPAAMTKPG